MGDPPEAQMLRVLQICLKGDARASYEEYVNGLGETPLTLNGAKRALDNRFAQGEDPDKVWHSMQKLMQGDNKSVDSYDRKFVSLWESLCRALPAGQVPPDMMKKDRFMVGLNVEMEGGVKETQDI